MFYCGLLLIFMYLFKFSTVSSGDFDPFMDQTMFMIDWKGPLQVDQTPAVKRNKNITAYN